MDTADLYSRSVASWLERVELVGPGDWERPTPCSEWSIRDLVNHVVGEDLWTVPLMEGRTMTEVGDAFDGDLLGDDPLKAAHAAADAAVRCVTERLTAELRVHLSYGDEDAHEYVHQLTADHLIHSWDLAAALGSELDLDDGLVEAVGGWFAGRAALYREAGLVGREVAADASGAQPRLVASWGRDPAWSPTSAAVDALAAAFGAGDVDAIMAVMTDDCVFEATSPAPDGVRVVGAEAVRAAWTVLFGQTPDPLFETEETVVAGDRAVLRWRFSWGGETPGHVRGVDVLRVVDGKVAEKLSYVKG